MNIWAAFLLSFTAASFAVAQNAQPNISVELRFLTNDKVSGLFLQPSPSRPGQVAPKAEIVAGSHSRSPGLQYTGPSSLTLFTVSTDPKGLEIRSPVASLALPSDKKELLIVILVGGAAAGPRQYRLHAFDDSFLGAPSGSVRFLNMTPVPVFGRMGSDSIQIKAGVSMSEAYPRAAARRISLGYTLNNQVFPIIDQAYGTEPADRLLIVLLPPFARGSGLIRARVIPDSPIVAEAPANPVTP
jgi:hypothetical protein